MAPFCWIACGCGREEGSAEAIACVAGKLDAGFTCWPALTWTVLTRTGFIGSDEPGIAEIAWLWITPLVSGAGSGLACGGGSAAVALAMTEGLAAGGAARIGAASSGAADAI